MKNIEFSISLIQVLTLLVGVIAPIVVGLVTTRVTTPRVKAITLLAVTGAAGLLGELLHALKADETYDLGVGLLLALSTFFIGVASHFGLWAPTGVSAAAADALVKPKESKTA